jgi:UDP-3-O-[3-hydroxymyristoyl] N-acetylglucosamine deacetylase
VRVIRQTTLRAAIAFNGIGLHSGAPAALTIRPAPANSGIVFVRTDGERAAAPIAASHDHVVGTTMCTTLGLPGGPSIATVEHVMAALAGLGIDNAVLEVAGPEVPVMDGSAAPFVAAIDRVGLSTLAAARRCIRVLKPVTVTNGARSATLAPASSFIVGCAIAYDGPPIDRQSASFRVTPEVFRRQIASARTYGFLEEIESLRARGLALGGSLDNAIVVGDRRVLNDGGLRFADEFVRHKILDGIGDLALAGAPIIGHFHGEASGHALNHALLRALFDDASAFAVEVAREPAHAVAVAWAQPQLASA